MTNLKRIAFVGLLMGMAFGVIAYAGRMDGEGSKFAVTETDRAEVKSEETVQVRTPANEDESTQNNNRLENRQVGK